jgi:hypothetical protein
MRLIIHAGTGTIIPADECLVVTITDDIYPLDHEIVERAEEYGLPISELLSSNTMSFSPLALREEARELLGGGGYYDADDTSPEAEAVRWCAYIATDDELNEVGQWIMNDDDLWQTYRTSFTEGIRWGYGEHGNLKGDDRG